VLIVVGTGCAKKPLMEEIDIDNNTSIEGDNNMANENVNSYGNLTFIGRASVRIELDNGTVIYIDPAEGEKSEYKTPADIVLVTHQHGDHNQVDLVTMKEGGVVIQCPYDIHAGETVTEMGIEIIAVSAYNDNHPADQGCGYVLKYNDLTIYHSGDTSTTDSMASLADYHIDYALICMDGYYNMGPEEAMKVADLIKPRFVIPIHTSKNGLFDQSVIDKFEYESTVVLNAGESVELQ